MKLRTVTLDKLAIENVLMERTDIDKLLNQGDLPGSDAFTRATQIENHGFLLSRTMKDTDPVVVVSLADDGPIFGLDPKLRQEAFDRAIRCALVGMSHQGVVPVSWRPFHSGNIISFQASRKGVNESARIVLELTADQTPHAYVFLLTRTKVELGTVRPSHGLFWDALMHLEDARTAQDSAVMLPVSDISDTVRLTGGVLRGDTQKLTFEEWYKSRLTADQLRFVNHPLSRSVRVVGPAGSGKTVSLVVKTLRELQQSRVRGEAPRFLMITHAVVNADVISSLLAAMDPEGILTRGPSGEPLLEVSTIYSLANKHMHYDLEDLTPLSLDGQEGRTLQSELIDAILQAFITGDWVAYKNGCSPGFVEWLESPSGMHRQILLWELMNEFACVLDADGIKTGPEKVKQYLDGERRKWMMNLQTREERATVLEIYRRFRSELKDMNTIGVDQMISDYLNYLDSNKWEVLRPRLGYDVVFVDELHLFNKLERMVLRHLTRDPLAPPIVVMAYDAKQSPRDTFAGIDSASEMRTDFLRDTSVGQSEKYELVDVFRYSPEIARSLALIDGAFPGQDLDDEWPSYRGISKIASGPKPLAYELKNTRDIFDTVFPKAREMQRGLKNGARVAVLCVSNSLFSTYASAGKYSDTFVVISSRDDLPRLKGKHKKFIFSAPEYVAGLQFDTVLLIEVNENEVPTGPYSASARRKFVSTVYLGASRAERVLELYATKEGGGLSLVVQPAITAGAIEHRNS